MFLLEITANILVRSENSHSCRAILERLGRRKDYEERKGWKLKKGKRGFIGFAINEKRGGEGRQR